jgi:8-oxo-dGTP diphosphatase
MPLPKTPALTTDCAIFDRTGRVLLIRRGHPPFQGAYALPGGFIEIGETVEDACRREVLEEVGLEVGELRLAGVYSDPGRDPRGHTVSVAFLAVLPRGSVPRAGSDAAGAEWVDDWRAVKLAFDHAQILADAEALKNEEPSGKVKTRR